MKKYIFALLFIGATIATKAQTTNAAITEHDSAVKAKDAQIKTEIIDPAQAVAKPGDPDWDAITKTITAKYDAVTADRTITKAKIYYYYGKDWPEFCAGIVHYTDNFELADDYKLLDKNAAMILKNSDDKAQLKEALKWSKAALDSNPGNENFKATYDALLVKLSE